MVPNASTGPRIFRQEQPLSDDLAPDRQSAQTKYFGPATDVPFAHATLLQATTSVHK
jgi:hypothetical protein